MRFVAVAAIVLVVAYCAWVALAPQPKLDAELADARYVVAPPATAAVVPIALEDVPPTSTAPDPARVDPAAAVRVLNAQQVTPTVPPAPVGLHGLPLAPSGLTACETASFYRAQAGLPARFDGIIWRESRCDPTAANWCCSGLLQVHKLWVAELAGCDVYVRDDLFDPQRNMCAASYVYAAQGITAWSTA